MVSLFGGRRAHRQSPCCKSRSRAWSDRLASRCLPGGVDAPPQVTGSCPRVLVPATDDATPTGYRANVRKWALNCTGANSAVPGRGVTIVRLDTGEIIRHFGRQQDVPAAVWAQSSIITPAPFDSPMSGTPVVYPQITGAVAQKIFIGDSDGAVWRIDVSNTDPSKWNVQLFADLIPTGPND